MREAPVKTTAFQQGILVTSTKAKERIGTLRILEDGRKFRYAKAAAAITAGQATSAAVIAAAHIGGSIAASNRSGMQIEVTITAGTAIAQNALAGGYVHVTAGLLAGRSYRIDSNTAVDAAGTSITLGLADRLVDYDGTTAVTLVHNPWYGVGPSATPEALCTGVALVDVAQDAYFWVQTGGPAAALISGTPAVGTMLTMGAVDGSLAAINTVLDIDQPIVAISWGTVGVDAEFKPVDMLLD